MKPSSNDPPELQSLRQASEGLLYPSETDAPFDTFALSPDTHVTDAKAAVAALTASGRRVEEVSLDTFFAALAGSDDAPRFQRLREVLAARLTGVRVFRVGVGETKVDIYLVGQTRSRQWAGLHTVSVET